MIKNKQDTITKKQQIKSLTKTVGEQTVGKQIVVDL